MFDACAGITIKEQQKVHGEISAKDNHMFSIKYIKLAVTNARFKAELSDKTFSMKSPRCYINCVLISYSSGQCFDERNTF